MRVPVAAASKGGYNSAPVGHHSPPTWLNALSTTDHTNGQSHFSLISSDCYSQAVSPAAKSHAGQVASVLKHHDAGRLGDNVPAGENVSRLTGEEEEKGLREPCLIYD